MATTPEEFIKKNMKWITISLFTLLMIKSIQSCNRNITISELNKKNEQLKDSLTIELKNYQDEVKRLGFEVKLSNALKEASDSKAEAVQSTAEKTRSNTTVVVKGAEEVNNKESENGNNIKK